MENSASTPNRVDAKDNVGNHKARRVSRLIWRPVRCPPFRRPDIPRLRESFWMARDRGKNLEGRVSIFKSRHKISPRLKETFFAQVCEGRRIKRISGSAEEQPAKIGTDYGETPTFSCNGCHFWNKYVKLQIYWCWDKLLTPLFSHFLLFLM